MFESIAGNEPIKSYLRKAFRENQLPQTLLFAGIDGIGKSLFAKDLASELLGSKSSPDLHLMTPEGKSGLYAIDTIRSMIEKEHAAPFEAPGKVFILFDAHRMQPSSANALLKTLEEPVPDTTFILLSSAPQEFLPTILSRCVTLSFQPLGEHSIASLLSEKGHPPHFAKLAHGSAGRAFELAECPELEDQRKILFNLLRERPPFYEIASQLEKLEEGIGEAKEADSVKGAQRAEYLFIYILMWHRDQYLRKTGAASSLLFFPEEPLSEGSFQLSKIEKSVEAARLAYQRNIKLSVCLKMAIEG